MTPIAEDGRRKRLLFTIKKEQKDRINVLNNIRLPEDLYSFT